jgi:tetratricopeptide (TPR) repeat protein
MKKEDIKKDPIRDRILNTLTYLSQNPQKFINYTIAITILLLTIIIYTNKNSNKLIDYNLGVSINQNRYVDSDKDLAVSNFNEIIESYSHSESSNQAFIYLLNNAVEKNDSDAIEALIANYSFNSTDKTLQSLIYYSYANYFVSIEEFKEAEDYYIKAINSSDNKEHINKFNLNLIYLHLNNANYSRASVIMDGINIEEVTPYQLKNKYEQLKSSLN